MGRREFLALSLRLLSQRVPGFLIFTDLSGTGGSGRGFKASVGLQYLFIVCH